MTIIYSNKEIISPKMVEYSHDRDCVSCGRILLKDKHFDEKKWAIESGKPWTCTSCIVKIHTGETPQWVGHSEDRDPYYENWMKLNGRNEEMNKAIEELKRKELSRGH